MTDKPNPINDYLDLIPTASTRRAHRSNLFSYLDSLYGKQRAERTCTPGEAERYEDLARALLNTEKPADTLARFVVALANSPPTTAAQRFAVAVDWLSFHGHEISPREKKTLSRRLPKGGAQTIEGDLDPAILKQIVLQLDLRGRALVVVLASSGMRIGELLQVGVRDVNLAASPAEIKVRGAMTKTGKPRTVFISTEAAGAVKEWLKVRDSREDLAVARSAGVGGKSRDARLFPYASKTIQQMWLGAVKKAGLLDTDPTTNRATLHLHMLRKFYLSQGKLGAPAEVIEMLAGHEGYLSGAYRRYTKRELAEHYLRAEPYLTIMVPTEYRALQSRTTETIDTQRSIIDSLTAKSLRADERLEELEERDRERERVIRMLQDVLGAVDPGE